MLIASIPIIGYLMLVKWSTSNDNPDKKNWAIATLIFLHVGFFCLLFNVCNVASC